MFFKKKEEYNTLHMMVGLPRSGKSTYARKLSKKKRCPIVSPDCIRLALFGQPFYRDAEPMVWAIAKTTVRALFLAGHRDVILDATSVNSAVRNELIDSSWTREFHVIDTCKEVCIERAIINKQEELIEVIERLDSIYEPIDDYELDR